MESITKLSEGLSEFAVRLLDEMSRDGYAAELQVSGAGAHSMRITPTMTDADGLTAFAEGAAFDRIGARLVRLSGDLGTSWRVDGAALVVDGLA